jgi:hypothetical protein
MVWLAHAHGAPGARPWHGHHTPGRRGGPVAGGTTLAGALFGLVMGTGLERGWHRATGGAAGLTEVVQHQ